MEEEIKTIFDEPGDDELSPAEGEGAVMGSSYDAEYEGDD